MPHFFVMHPGLVLNYYLVINRFEFTLRFAATDLERASSI